eukprot:TRINITY_DN6682_c1_g1_i1.p1 TRINITY_DN6682_c1_g1~~TRINITY_DN6682_c1_g1_i1.p1  ORF type:complete len:438 (+),score=101.99 TRINITY_DN6682_c1_g1_i1:140-1453(+)
MRFGKKLACQVMSDGTGAPYLSHKHMKEAINIIVRELRHYQVRESQETADGKPMVNADGVPLGAEDCKDVVEDLSQLEQRIREADRQLFVLVDQDLENILAHIRRNEAGLGEAVAKVQEEALSNGFLLQEGACLPGLLREELFRGPPSVMPSGQQHSMSLACAKLIDLQLRCDPVGMAGRLLDLAGVYTALVDNMNQHLEYLEINVAGFRKLLKRHDRQIPVHFRSRSDPCLGFHRFVTRTTIRLLEVCEHMREIVEDCYQRLQQSGSHEAMSLLPSEPGELHKKLTGLGQECKMVLEVQKQLRGETIVPLGADSVFQKPEVPPQPQQNLNKPQVQNQPAQQGQQGGGQGRGSRRQQQQQQHQQQNTNWQQPQSQQQQPPRGGGGGQRLPAGGAGYPQLPFDVKDGIAEPGCWWVAAQMQNPAAFWVPGAPVPSISV